MTGRLTIPTADGYLLHYSAVASEPLESASKAAAAEVAASSCLRKGGGTVRIGVGVVGLRRGGQKKDWVRCWENLVAMFYTRKTGGVNRHVQNSST